jgi:UDP-glucose 4-epimerase
MTILVTGGAGYIGSHTCVALLESGFEVVIIDNLSNSSLDALKGIQKITGKQVGLYQIDLRNTTDVKEVFKAENIDAVIHFAGLKAVGESAEFPLMYYDNNLGATLALLQIMSEFQVKNLVFSSSATVYGNPSSVPIDEDFPLFATNPYGMTKLMIENMLKDISKADPLFNIVILRYFNPAGAHKSGLIGENPKGIPNNLFPFISQVASGKRPKLSVFGGDYATGDGTGVRDYIHVCDLAAGHLAALESFKTDQGLSIYNLGTGIGYSVLDIIAAFEKANGLKIPYEIVGRRSGDIDACYANQDKAFRHLKWKAKMDLAEMCKDAWMFEFKHFGGR